MSQPLYKQPEQSGGDITVEIVNDPRTESMRKSALTWNLLAIICGHLFCACCSIPAFISALDRGKHISVYSKAKRTGKIVFIVALVSIGILEIAYIVTSTLEAIARNSKA